MATSKQPLPSAGPARELLREKGQFWTPDWVADAMVAYVLGAGADEIFDPAVGAGAFFRAGRRVGARVGRQLRLRGAEVDPEMLREAARHDVSADDLLGVGVRDFLLHPPEGPLQAIVANPPYIRHHRVADETKAALRALGVRVIGRALDGRAGLHVYFLLQALQLLGPDGRLAFIVPADTCEGKFAPLLWQWITAHYRLEQVIAFTPDATPFPKVDTNALVLMIQNAPPADRLLWTLCSRPDTDDLTRWSLSAFTEYPNSSVAIVQIRSLSEALRTGLSRPPRAEALSGVVLGDYAKVMRGIATGANEFFLMTRQRAMRLGIPDTFFVPTLARTRDVVDDEVTGMEMEALEVAGRPTRLLSLGKRPIEAFPDALQTYLRQGEHLGLPKRPLIAQRKPWYKMETREPPPFLFAYLGRRNARFVRNRAGVVPLTCFLCVYPKRRDEESIEQLWRILRHPQTIANLALVGKSYGGGAIKVEPRALEKLPIPAEALESAGIPPEAPISQLSLLV